MKPCASTTDMVKLLQAFEAVHGPGVITGITSYCACLREYEYAIHIKRKDGVETTIKIPSIDEAVILEALELEQ